MRTKAEIVRAAWDLAKARGIGRFSLRELAERVGMRAPSLYQYFETKNDLYDAMFRDGYVALREHLGSQEGRTEMSREDIKEVARKFFDFCTQEPVRYSLMCERPIPGFEPSAESAALAEEVLSVEVKPIMASLGIDDLDTMRLFLAVSAGVVSQQNATNPGGRDWRPLMDRAMDMFLDHVGVARREAGA